MLAYNECQYREIFIHPPTTLPTAQEMARTPLARAAAAGDAIRVEALLAEKEWPLGVIHHALREAAFRSHPATVRVLLANTDASTGPNGLKAFIIGCAVHPTRPLTPDQEEVLDLFLAHPGGWPEPVLLKAAAHQGASRLVKCLLDRSRSSPSNRSTAVLQALMFLAREGSAQGLECLLEASPSPEPPLFVVMQAAAASDAISVERLSSVFRILAPRMTPVQGAAVFDVNPESGFPVWVDRISPLVPLSWLQALSPSVARRFPGATARLAAEAFSQSLPSGDDVRRQPRL